MPIAATGAPPATPEPRVRPRVPKRAPEGDYGAPEAALDADRLPSSSSPFLVAPSSPPALSPHPMATEPPRTRSRSRSGFYQSAGANGGAGSSGANLHHLHHHHHHQHQQHHQQHQISGACAVLGAHPHPENLRPPAGMLSPSGHRHPGPGAHRSPGGAGNLLRIIHMLVVLL